MTLFLIYRFLAYLLFAFMTSIVIIHPMATVLITGAAREQVSKLPVVIQIRVAEVIERLAKWPAVSGAKPLRHDLKGQFRIRTGDYRVVFNVTGDVVTIVNVDNRRDVYK